MKCGLLGRKLSHSHSPEIHKQLGSYDYSLFEIEPEALPAFLTERDFDGINVTIPYKKAIIPYCDRLTEVAQKLGAVNTVIRNPDGSLTGHNTDYFGFQSMLHHSGLQVDNKKVLVLGSGGASNTVCAVLRELGARVIVISRSGENNYGNLGNHRDAALLVNTTPVGMYPAVDEAPLSLDCFPHLEGVLDLIYNPLETRLLLDARNRNLTTENGLWMLIAQAKESAQWFTGKEISDSVIARIYKVMSQQFHSLILIGMPGCGKSTVGALLAQRLGREFVDADVYLEKAVGISIPEIFQKHGEQGFRQMETQVLSQLGKRQGLVIATGGGCVTVPENYGHLHQNGMIIWLKRSLKQLPTEGRPLSQATTAEAMYNIRQPLYQAFSDYEIENSATPETTAQAILHTLDWKSYHENTDY